MTQLRTWTRFLLLVFSTFFLLGPRQADATPISYTFEFSNGATFSYLASVPTLPGTGIDYGTISGPGLLPPSGGRNSGGDWYFSAWFSPTYTVAYDAFTGLAFANSPGVYTSIPSLVTPISPFPFERPLALSAPVQKSLYRRNKIPYP